MPGLNVFALLSVTTVLFPGITGVGVKLTVVPAGTPFVAVKLMGVLKPPLETVPNVTVARVAAAQVILVGPGAVKEKPVGGAVTVIFALFISK